MASFSTINPIPPSPGADLDELSESTQDNPPRAVIGKPPNHWLHSPSPPTFDLTRPSPPNFLVPSPTSSIRVKTTTTSIMISPPLTALVIIDMQNFFLSTCLGRPADGAGNKAGQCLIDTAIPAARRAGIRIIWLNWGLTDDDIDQIPASIRRAFGFEAALRRATEGKALPVIDAHGVNQAAAEGLMKHESCTSDLGELTENGKPTRIYKGLGSDIGPVTLKNRSVVEGGRLLMRHTWNAALPPALDASYKEGARLNHKPDVWIHKNRMSGFWGSSTPCTEFLEQEGIRTLLFAGVNTDQCVGGSLQDAFTKGWDCILLTDACGTTSPKFASECVEFNCARTWGFCCDCKGLQKGVDSMLDAT